MSYIKLKNPRIVLFFILFFCTPPPSSTCCRVKFRPRGQAMPVQGTRVGAQAGVEGALLPAASLRSRPPAPESGALRECPTG